MKSIVPDARPQRGKSRYIDAMQTEQPPPPTPRPSPKNALVVILLILGAFLLGWLPKEIEGRRLESTLRTTQLDLRLTDLHRQLGVASHQAMLGDFPAAGIAALGFYDGCRALAESGALEDRVRTRTALGAYAGQRDEMLARVAVADPSVREGFASLYLTMNGVIERRQ